MNCSQPSTLAKLLLAILLGVVATGCGEAATPSSATTIQIATFTLLPTAVIIPQTETPVPCPSDPNQWNLVEVTPNNNYKRIEPGCAYKDLSRTVAWIYAVRQGYSRKDAAQKLGFDEFPVEYFDQVKIITDKNVRKMVKVSYASNNADLKEWRLDKDLQPGLVYSLRGCFRTVFVSSGGEASDWSNGYSVICIVDEDDTSTYYIVQIADYIFSKYAADLQSTNWRAEKIFGYSQDKGWVWLGSITSTAGSLDKIQNPSEDRTSFGKLYGTEVWDANWMQETFGLMVQPLPDNWKTSTDQDQIQAIMDIINATPDH